MELAPWLATRQASRRAQRALLGSVVLTVVLYFVPFGRTLAYPLTLLSTLVHELGHGLAALAVGHSFKSLAIFPDASGVAQHAGPSSPMGTALISAGGLVGPAMASAVGFAFGRSAKASRFLLCASTVLLAIVMALFVRNPFGLGFVGLVALGLGYIGVRKPQHAQLGLVFVSVQLALSVFSRADYLFTDTAVTGAGTMPSDVAQIANALGGPYWVWGLACGMFSVAVLAGGITWFWRAFRTRSVAA